MQLRRPILEFRQFDSEVVESLQQGEGDMNLNGIFRIQSQDNNTYSRSHKTFRNILVFILMGLNRLQTSCLPS